VLERLLDDAPRFLKPGGALILEIGAAQEEAVRQCFEARPGYTVAPTILDHARHPRVICATWR
jgi:release factor glutamine methyltransferase